MRAKKTTTITFDFRIEVIRDLIIREIIEKDGRFKDISPEKSMIQVTNNETILKVTIEQNEYLKYQWKITTPYKKRPQPWRRL